MTGSKSSSAVKVCSDRTELSQQAATHFSEIARRAVVEQGYCAVCLSGGSTPRETYELLAREPFSSEVPWSQIHIFWGDERCVPPDQADNHHRMASELLLTKVPIPSQNIHRVPVELNDPTKAAEEYESLIRSFFGDLGKKLPSFDLILLGMGADGHMASLFPGTEGLNEIQSWVTAHYVPKLDAFRITLTLPVLNNARQVMFLVSGAAKAEALQSVLQGSADLLELPARLVRPEGTVLWLVDQSAASLLELEELSLN